MEQVEKLFNTYHYGHLYNKKEILLLIEKEQIYPLYYFVEILKEALIIAKQEELKFISLEDFFFHLIKVRIHLQRDEEIELQNEEK